MAYQGIGTGTLPNDNTGDNLRDAGIKINDNFSEIYNHFGDGTDLTAIVGTGIATESGVVGTGVTLIEFKGSAVGEVVVQSGIATITVSDFQESLYGNSDVDTHLNLSSAGTNEVLSYDGSDYTWVSNAGYTNSNVDTHLNQSTAGSGQVLGWNGTDYNWVDQSTGGGGATNLNGLTDVTITTPSSGQVLKYNGSNWVNDTDATGGSGGISGIVVQEEGSDVGTATTINFVGTGVTATFDSGIATVSIGIPTDTGDLTNNAGFVTFTNVSQLTNDSGYITAGSTFSGDYNNLTNKPTLFSGNYSDLTDKPTIPADTGDLTNNVGFITAGDSGAGLTALTGATQGTYGNATNSAQIEVDANGRITSINSVAISGGGGGGGISGINVFNNEETSAGVTTIISFNDNLTAASIGNTVTVSVTGVVTSLTGYTTTGDVGTSIASSLTGYATESYVDSTVEAAIPTVNNATLTLSTSGDGITGSDTFTANQSTDTTFTVTVSSASTNEASTLVYRDADGGFSAGLVTATALSGFEYLQAPHGTTVEFAVTVASKTSAHRYPGGGSSSTSAYFIDGVESPFLTLTPGRTYRFTNDNTGSHPLKFYLEADKTTEYTSGVSFQNSYTEITVSDETPTVLHYQCSAHGYMGNAVQTNSNKVNSPYGIVGAAFSTANGTSSQFLKADGSVDSHTYLTSLGTAILDGDFTSNGFMKRTGAGTYETDNSTYLTSESDTLDSVTGRGNTTTNGIKVGVITATELHTGAEGSSIRVTSDSITGPSTITIDPAAVGDNTGDVRIKGNLYVDGTTTQINSTTIELADFIVGIATTATTDVLADGAGIQIGPDNTLKYEHSNTALKSSENLNLATDKTYKINGTDVLSATTLGSGVTNSSLTSVGTLEVLNVTGIVTGAGFSTAGGTSSQFLKADGSVDSNTYLTAETSHSDVLVDGDFTSNGFMKRTGAGTYETDNSTYLTSESDPVVAAINGIVKSDGSTIAAATAGTDYLAPSSDGSSLSGVVTSIVAGDNITLDTDASSGIVTVNASGGNSFGIISVSGRDNPSATTPADTLELIGGTNISLDTNTSTDPVSVTINATGNASSQWTTNGSDIYYNTTGGGVAIGTDSAETALEVHNTATFHVNDTNHGAWPSADGSGTAIRVHSTYLSNYDATGNGSVSSLDGSRFQVGRFPANVSIANSLGTAGIHFADGSIQDDVTGSTQYSGGFTLFGRNTTYSSADNFITANPDWGVRIGYSGAFTVVKTSLNGNGSDAATPLFSIESDYVSGEKLVWSGNDVGIGIANPTAKLHVNGTVAIGSSVYDSNGDLGTDGQLLTHVTGVGVSWTDVVGVTDGDKGDIIVTGSGSSWVLDNDVVGPDELQDTAVTAGTYSSANITVDAQGRITSATSGGGVSGAYSDADVDTHLNQSNPTSGHVLSWNGTDYAWVAQSGGSGGGTGVGTSRFVVSQQTGFIAANATADVTIANAAKAYSLLKVEVDHPAWVRLYTDTDSRTNDASRAYTTDPTPGSGVLAEVYTTSAGISTFKMTPAVIGWNDDATPSDNIYAKVTNTDASNGRQIEVSLTIVRMEE